MLLHHVCSSSVLCLPTIGTTAKTFNKQNTSLLQMLRRTLCSAGWPLGVAGWLVQVQVQRCDTCFRSRYTCTAPWNGCVTSMFTLYLHWCTACEMQGLSRQLMVHVGEVEQNALYHGSAWSWLGLLCSRGKVTGTLLGMCRLACMLYHHLCIHGKVASGMP